MKLLVKTVNRSGAKKLELNNSNQFDQLNWPVILRTQI